MIQLSQHFTLEEATLSETAARNGIDNSHPDARTITTASNTAVRMEIVRQILGAPIHINSWIRCLELNRALKSSDHSQHILGEAVDFICPGFGTPTQVAETLLEFKDSVGFDQLILEYTWVHISWKSLPNAVQRGEVLSLLPSGGYANGLITT